MSASTAAPSSSHTTRPKSAAIITYRYKNKMVYVTPAETYDDAIKIAQDEFPELAERDADCISLSLNSTVKGQRVQVRISSMAWKTTVADLIKHEIIEVEALDKPPRSPRVVVHGVDDAPPSYNSDEKRPYLTVDAPSRSPSPSPRSRSGSPATTSGKGPLSWIKGVTGSR